MLLAAKAREQMESSIVDLPAIETKENPDDKILQITFLTGDRFWYQTVYCAYSLLHYSPRPIRLKILDDGTLKSSQIKEIVRIFPIIQIDRYEKINKRIEEVLPESKFPRLRERRINYPHIRKLTDVHAGCGEWQLVLDSDMMFLNIPEHLLQWLDCPTLPYYMLDRVSSYGYSVELMKELAGCEIPNKLNVGIIGLNGGMIDWEKLEYWTDEMIKREGTSYYQEQALTAMLVGENNACIAPMNDYICLPNQGDIISRKGVLHHYVDTSKNAYFRFAWQQFNQMVRGV